MPYLIAAAMGFAVIGVVWYGTAVYNGLVALENEIDRAWANVDVLLKQRHDELTELVETCKGYMKYEHETLERVAAARGLLASAATPTDMARADLAARAATRGLFAVAENYPELKANTTFQWLQKRITELEDQIADRREFYNESVKTYNTRLQTIPDAFAAAVLRFRPHALFKAEDAGPMTVAITAAR